MKRSATSAPVALLPNIADTVPLRADAIRTYRVDRIRAVQQTAREFKPPGGLERVAAVEVNLGTGWEFPTRVVFDAPLALVGSTSNPAMYAQEWLASMPFAFRVDGGQELRAAVATLASRFAAALADQS
jgi:hypothetical protein